MADDRLANGLSILVADLPGRPLVSATVVLPVGAVDEPAAHAGSAVLAARALTEGIALAAAIAAQLTEFGNGLGVPFPSPVGVPARS